MKKNMKKSVLIVTCIIFIGILISVGQTRQMRILISGLSCEVCYYGLEKNLKQIDGIENLHIELKTGLITFNTRNGKNVLEDEIRAKVKDAGYTVVEIKYVDLPKK